jgi:hypothetical protein
MEERRKNSRMDLKSRLVMKRLDDPTQGQDVAIEVTDVSKSGVGFKCTEILTIGAVYESFLTIWTKEVLHALLEIVRIEKKEDGPFDYGAIFIGMPEMDAARIETYHTIESLKQ